MACSTLRPSILALDTATDVCSMALFDALSGELFVERIAHESHAHAALIGPFMQELLNKASERHLGIVAIATAAGPGSYTGLRIGAGIAKGYCMALDLPLLAISSLDTMIAGFLADNEVKKSATLVSMMDAGRMEVYAAEYNAAGTRQSAITAKEIQPNSYHHLGMGEVYFIGNGALKCQEILSNSRHHFIFQDSYARHMAPYAVKALKQQQEVDLAYWQPDYIKPYRAIVGRNKVLDPYLVK